MYIYIYIYSYTVYLHTWIIYDTCMYNYVYIYIYIYILSKVQVAEFQIEDLKSHVQMHSKSIISQHLVQEMYACNN